MRVEVFKQEHAKLMKTRDTFSEDFASHAPYSFSIFRKRDDALLFCGGVAQYWPGRGETWAVFNEDLDHRHDFPKLHRLIKIIIDDCPTRRLELSVREGFTNGHRWARALGFSLEAKHLEAYFPDGSSASLYSRIRQTPPGAPCRS